MVRRSFTEYTVTLLILVLLAGCATIIHGTRQEVSISSTPAGANVTIDDSLHVGVTPLARELKRKKKERRVCIELDGYELYELTIERKLSGWYAGNIVFEGLIRLVVDGVNGAMYKLTPNQIKAEMREAAVGTNLKDNTLYVAVVLEPDPTWERVGALTPAER